MCSALWSVSFHLARVDTILQNFVPSKHHFCVGEIDVLFRADSRFTSLSTSNLNKSLRSNYVTVIDIPKDEINVLLERLCVFVVEILMARLKDSFWIRACSAKALVPTRYLVDEYDNSRKLLYAKHQITYNTNSWRAFKITTKTNIFSMN